MILTSADGLNWHSVKSQSFDLPLRSVTYGNGRFIAAGGFVFTGGAFQPVPRILNSPDGAIWNVSDAGVTDTQFFGVAYGNGTFVAVGHYDFPFLASSDGVNWTPAPINQISHANGIAYGNGIFVAVGIDGAIYTSAEGINWTARQVSVSTEPLYGVTFGKDMFIMYIRVSGTMLPS